MFPNLLIELKKQRCTQQDLAQHIGISRATMQNKLTGHSKFTLREMKAIQGALKGCTLDYLFTECSTEVKP